MTFLRLYSRWLLSFIGTALLALVVWYFGPLLDALEPVAARLGIVLVMLLIWAVINFLLDWRRRRRDTVLVEGVAEPAPDATAQASADEIAALRDKLTAALALLRKASGSKGYLYERPWYLIIGPPGAGKTTALLNAGLQFPLAHEMGQGAVAGVGGTRLCDWWFTEDAVLIDTAGRYTTQDSDAAVDRAGWEGFLNLLKRTRSRQPVNGVIVAISIIDIAEGAPEALAHARAIRRRIKELEERLAVRLPVYALFTKIDLIAGFTEFFDDLGREGRTQVWGATFPLTTAEAGPVAGFGDEFAGLVARLDERLFDRMQTERSPDRRSLIAGFPSQVESLETIVGEFLREAFGGSRLDPAPMLRGFYLTSGTQEGTPIDRLTGFLARNFGIDQRRAASLQSEGRSYFLTRLLKEVIFGEAMLVSERPGVARRRMLLRAGGFALAGLAVLVGGGLIWHTSSESRAQIERANDDFAAYLKASEGLTLDPVSDGDLPQIAPLLDQARGLRHAASAAWFVIPGLSRERELAAGARTVYRHALERVLLPRLIWRLEAQMHGNMSRPDFLYEATRIYLMLGNEGPLDRNLVEAWMRLDWESAYSGPAMGAVREDLQRHLVVLLADPLPQIPLDGALVAAARATFSRVPLANRAYSRIAPSAAAQAIPGWNPESALGAAGVKLFVRPSGIKLTDGVPGFYTIDGFYKVLLPALGNAANEVASESWVLGTHAELRPGSPEVRQLERDVVALYEADYQKRWDALLADIDIVPLRTPQQAAQDLYVLGSPQSPLRDLLTSVAHQLTLTKAPPPPPAAAAASATFAAMTTATTASAQRAAQNVVPQSTLPIPTPQLSGLFAPTGGPPPQPPGKTVEDHYQPLLTFIGTGVGAPLDQALSAINALQKQLTVLPAAVPGAPPAPAVDDPVAVLRNEAARDPQPAARWLSAIANSAAAIRSGSTADQIKTAWNAPDGPALLCKEALLGRYPFNRGATNDAPLDDFNRLLAPSGLLNTFFNTQLRPYVNITGQVWALQSVDGVVPPVSPAALAQFQRAAAIRELFFGAGGSSPSVSFELTPKTLDAASKEATLELGGTKVTASHATPRATQVTWPGNGMSNARLVFDPPLSGGIADAALQASGPWAMFRLFDQGYLQQLGTPDRYLLTFQVGDRQASFELRAGSVLNPFQLAALRDFRCPTL
jgi:type VI secretion system protein ImpL